MKFVDIPTAVEARFDEEGRITPPGFRWQGREVRIELCLDTGTFSNT